MIDATDLIDVRMSTDGKSLRLHVRDRSGQTVSVAFPACWLNTMLNAVPQAHSPDTVHLLDSWSMDRLGNGQDLILTLRTPEGQAVSFAIKPWQVEGMATIATYGNSRQTPDRTLH